MRKSNWEVATKHYCLLGEGPVWDAKLKRVLWVDILKGDVEYFYPESREHKTLHLNRMVGAIALKRSGGVIAAVKGGFAIIEPENGAMHVIAEVEAHLPGNRFNDGKCDPAGRFWAGTMSMLNTPHAGSLYVLEKNFNVTTKITGVTCSNGLAWSPDHTTLYYIDTPTRQVVAYHYNIDNGNISGAGVLINIPEVDGYPDGMTIDAEGMLWIALWDGWKVARYHPLSGKKLYEITLPVSRPTSCVFGGIDMDDLYITSAREGLSEQELKAQPFAGALFVIKGSGFTGIDGFEYGV